MYAKGRGVPKDDAEAVKWYRQAAEQGDADAQFVLGVKYDSGQGVPKDDAESVKWHRKAAEQSDADAQVALGIAYFTGRGVTKDIVLTYMWSSLAAAQGNKHGKQFRDIAAGLLTRTQKKEAERLVRDWKPKRN